jgi:hypothetical protein
VNRTSTTSGAAAPNATATTTPTATSAAQTIAPSVVSGSGTVHAASGGS